MQTKSGWLLLISNLSGHNPSLRMRTWRALKGAGVGLLRDGAYVLPNSPDARTLFETQGSEIKSAGGTAHLVEFESQSAAQQTELEALFDRTADYGELLRKLAKFKKDLAKLSEPAARQVLAGIVREASIITARDFFPGEPRRQVTSALSTAESSLTARFSPDEPHSAHRSVERRNPKGFRGCVWATRERLWIDRVASAWLIRRFIDPKAKFLWLKQPKDCPKTAIGFDFDGATFTHLDNRVTFEVLLLSFSLEADPGLMRLGALVHHLDIGGIPIPEAAGFATIMAGARSLYADDDALLKYVSPVLDGLYAGYAVTDQ